MSTLHVVPMVKQAEQRASIALLARSTYERVWTPETAGERLEAWLRRYPTLEAAVTHWIFFFGGLLFGLLLGKWLSS